MAQVWRLSSHYHFSLRVQKEMWNKVTEAKPKATLILVQATPAAFFSVQFIKKVWLLFQGRGEARSQFHLPPLIRVSWVTVRIKTKEKKLHPTPGKIIFSSIKGICTMTIHDLELMRTPGSLKSVHLKRLGGALSTALHDKGKVGISFL